MSDARYTSKVLGGIKSNLTLHGQPHPPNNMGAEITAPVAPEENQVLIDWLSWTLKDVTDPHEAIKKSGLSAFDFTASASGGMGYKSSIRSGNIVVYFDGNVGMGCHVSLTGQGCRQYDGMMRDKKHGWYQLFHRLQAIEAKITRLDIALDNVDGTLDLDKLEQDIKDKHVRSIFKGGHKHEKFSFGDDDDKQGKTIYLGSPASRIKFRFYDKSAQLGIDSHWVRCELQLMAERAQEAIKHILASTEVGTLAVSVLNQYFAVINLDDSNKSRCSLKSWWAAWLTNYDKMRLTVCKAIKLIPEVIDFLNRQYAPTFAMLQKYLKPSNFNSFIKDLVDNGRERLTSKHEFIIECSELEPLPF